MFCSDITVLFIKLASALWPVAGDFAFLLFTLGILVLLAKKSVMGAYTAS